VKLKNNPVATCHISKKDRRAMRQKTPQPDCVIFQGYIEPGSGYGYLWDAESKRQSSAHRYAYEKANGPIPEGAHICHTCDVRACVNPAHLFIGNHRVNMMDMRAKRRGRAPFMSDDGATWITAAEADDEQGAGAFSGD
jgi:hypothetical protein